MDLIGTRIKKNFQGFGIYNGIIESFEPTTGFFKVLYEDGDSEDLEFSEIQSILNETSQASQNSELSARKQGRPSNRKNKLEGESSVKSETLEPIKVNLPQSSSDLDLDGVNPFDLFSVYTCLRSFSRALFLSPFKLECFLLALRSEKANYLIDSIHFSIFQALKEHLELLSSSQPVSQSASICLRNINWEKLDFITWPMFLLNYLVIHASVIKSEVKLKELNLLDVEYYKQPVGVKLKILRYLCDDLLEVHSVKSEIDRHTMGYEFNEDVNFSQMSNQKRKSKSSQTLVVDSDMVEQVQETSDGNLDECCLCTMDGNLICCDGCPAAFHSKCVGVVKDLLPEGDWYCPECAVKKSEGSMKLSKLSGAELLGADPHGRLYFGSCDRLLVTDSYESYTSHHYYNKNDSYALITALKSSYGYSEILKSIATYWGFSMDAYPSSNQFHNNVRSKNEDMENETQSTPILPSGYNIPTDVNAEKPVVDSPSCKQADKTTSQISNLISATITDDGCGANSVQPTSGHNTSSDGNDGMLVSDNAIYSGQIGQEALQVPNLVIESLAENVLCADLVQSPPLLLSEHNVFDNKNVEKNVENSVAQKQNVPESSQIPNLFSVPITHNIHTADLVQSPQKNTSNGTIDSASAAEKIDLNRANLNDKKIDEIMDVRYDPQKYINYYIFGRIALSICKELKLNTPEASIDAPIKSVDDIKSLQIQAICNKSGKGYYCYAYRQLSINAEKENCDWCFSCRASDDSACLFKVASSKDPKDSKDGKFEGFNTFQTVRLSHLDSAICHILSIECRARSLLSGPWVKPHYSQHWRQIVTKASDVASLKQMLVILEFNLRRVALSTEWFKSVDDTHAIVSSCMVTSPIRSTRSSSKKRGRKSVNVGELTSISDRDKLSDTYWWRGGRLSRHVFQCKTLPRSLALKGGRQAGYKAIPDILYPTSSETPKRSKYISWRTAVEMSKSVAELIYYAKDFDSHVKWGELSNTCHPTKSGKESKKMAKLLKNVFICGKCNDGKQMKYLVDCGKKEILPAFITKHGVLLEDSTVDRRRFWLSEAHIPLNLLKAYEEKNIKKKMARLLRKLDPESSSVKESDTKSKKRKQLNITDVGLNTVNENEWNAKRRKRSEGLSFLYSRREESQKVLCQQCNKDVLVREAINCQLCDGLFHKKHVRGPKTATTTNYTCTNCKNTKCLNMEEKGRKGPKSKSTATNCTKGKGKESIDIGAKIKDTGNFEEKGIDEKGEGGSLKDVSNDKIHFMEMNTSNTKKKTKENGSTNEDNSIQKWNFRERKKYSKYTWNEEEVQKEVRPLKLKIKFQGRSIVPTTRESSENNLSEAVAENRQLVLKLSNKKCHKRSKKNKSESKKSRNLTSVKTWNKRKRSVVHHSYWLNGLLWTPKAVTEQQMHFRKENVILPLQNEQEPVTNPTCCLCHKEYNAEVIYISCERCHDWFHGDTFSLTAENIDNLIGFRCHKCRKRSEPECPFLNNALIRNTSLDIAVSEVHNDQDNNCSGSIDYKKDGLDVGVDNCDKIHKVKDKNSGYSDETSSMNGHIDDLEKLHGVSIEDYLVYKDESKR